MIDDLAMHMRPYPLLPPAPKDTTGEKSYTDMQSCIATPLLHCAFKDCTWCPDPKRTHQLYHWDLEWLLFEHLREAHQKDNKMAAVFEKTEKDMIDNLIRLSAE